MMTSRLISAVLVAAFCTSCVLSYHDGGLAVATASTAGGGLGAGGPSGRTGGRSLTKQSAAGNRVARSARSFIGRRNMNVGGRRFNYDCSGTILAIYYHAGIDLLPEFHRQGGNGVRRLYAIAADHRLLYAPKLPTPGDVIFWDNTYDRNGDGMWNDELTHAGIVVSVSEGGQVEYVHHNYRRGIVMERMNLLEPDVHTGGDGLVNSPMRMRSHRYIRPSEWLASHLYRGSGRLHEL